MRLFLFPHQDDEFFAAPLLVREPQNAWCVFLTQGDLHGHDPQKRDEESRRALDYLGVPASHICFLSETLRVPDTQLASHLQEVFLRIEALFFSGREAAVTEVYVPAYEGGHPDHDAACLLGVALGLRWHIPVRQFFAYQAHPWVPYYYRVLHHGNAWQKADQLPEKPEEGRLGWKTFFLFRFYPSQWRTWVGLLPPLAIHFVFRRRIVFPPVRAAVFSLPPHLGKLYYEYRRWTTFSTFFEQTEAFRNKYLS